MSSASLKYEVRSFSENWSGHGPHRIAISSNIIKKLFYTVVFLTCAVVCGVQINALIYKYYSYPVNTMTEILHDTLDFPAVTICNKNIVRKSKVNVGGTEFVVVIETIVEEVGTDKKLGSLPDLKTGSTTPDFFLVSNSKTGRTTTVSNSKTTRTTPVPYSKTGSTTSAPYSNNGRTTPVPNTNAYKPANEDWTIGRKNDKTEDKLYNVSSGMEFFEYSGNITWLSTRRPAERDAIGRRVSMALVDVNAAMRFTMGHQLDEMLQSCYINGETCSAQNFTMFYSAVYGNCYTFNGFGTAHGVRTFKSGPRLGLSMDLVVEQDEYVASLSRSAGIRMLVHEPFEFPFPEDSGIDLAPGKVTSVGMKLKIVDKLGEPYTKCTTGSDVNMAYTGNYSVEVLGRSVQRDTIN